MSRFARAGIATWLSIVLGASFGLVILAALFGLGQISDANHAVIAVRETWAPRLAALRELQEAVERSGLHLRRQLQTTNFHHLAEIAAELRASEAAVEELAAAYGTTAAGSAEQRALLHAFRDRWEAWVETRHAILAALDVGDVRQATAIFQSRSTAALEAASRSLDDLAATAARDSAQAGAAVAEVHDRAHRLATAAMLLGALLAVLMIGWTRRRIGAPIVQLAADLRRLAAGDLAIAPRWPERGDEIGTLAAAVTAYRDSLEAGRRLAREAERERERLRAAVANMPIGLCMFDAARRLVVCNGRFATIYGLRRGLLQPGTRFEAMLAAGEPAAPGGLQALATAMGRGRSGLELVPMPANRTISVTHQPLPDGGWVATHEDITERRRVEAQIAYLAHHDPLTGLANRALFRERLEAALGRARRGGGFAILYLDLDRFKDVNDTLGHPIGDALLRAVAERLQAALRETDTLARLGGDEFAVIQADAATAAGAAVLARRLVEELALPFAIDGHQVVIGTSIGITLAPADGLDADTLLKCADMALYRAKAEGRGCWHFFEQEMDARMRLRRALELDLRRALEAGEFELFYQPIVEVRTRRVSGFEALLRWRHPERGLVPPNSFVPLAEEIGLIIPIGEWVLARACADAAGWRGRPKVAVNLSAVQFGSRRLVDAIAGALAAAGLDPGRLELEITETVMLKDTEATLATLHRLKAIGVRISMDDFGTGYSSLSYLQRFPFDKVKIDRCFVRGLEDSPQSTAIVRAVTSLCAGLEMTTTAEGVETEGQMQLLLEHGCGEAQGYLFSVPRPAAEVPALLQQLEEEAAQVDCAIR